MYTSRKELKVNFLLVSFVFLFFALFSIQQNPNIIFLGNMVIMGLTIAKSGFSYFSLKTIVLNYVAIPIYYQYATGQSYGILQVTKMNLYYQELMIVMFIYNVLCLAWLMNSSILENEKRLLQTVISVPKFGAILCSVIAVMASLIAFPTIPFVFSVESRFVAILPGNAWNHLSLVALLFASKQIRNSLVVKISTFFCIFWFLAHYERVDVIGFLLGSIVVYCSAKEIKIEIWSAIKYGIFVFLLLIIMVYIGEARSQTFTGIGFGDVLRKMLIQNTASDIGYVFNCGVTYYHQEEFLMGKSYLTYLIESIPLLHSDVRTGLILKDLYYTPGGDFLLNEPLMNFGILGVIGFQLLEFSFLHKLLSKKGRYRYFVYVFLMMAVFRTTWYGLFYIETAMIYFMPTIYWISKLTTKKVRT